MKNTISSSHPTTSAELEKGILTCRLVSTKGGIPNVVFPSGLPQNSQLLFQLLIISSGCSLKVIVS